MLKIICVGEIYGSRLVLEPVSGKESEDMEEKNVTDETATDSVSEDNQKKKISPLKVLQIIFIIGIVVCVVILFCQYRTRQRAKSTFEDLQNRSTEAVGTNGSGDNSSGDSDATLVSDIIDDDQKDFLAEQGIEVPDKSLDWNAMQEQNADIYAWIYIPGTSVDYPVLQNAEDDDYYLKHNLDGSSGYPGCIYTQTVNNKDFTDLTTVLYGHNMKDGTMFKSLHNYSDETFFYNNRYIFVYTPEKVLVYKIFSAIVFGNGNIMQDYDMTDTGDRTEFISNITDSRSMSNIVDKSVMVYAESHIITLSTCLDSSSKSRWLVNGVLIEE